MAVDVCIPLGTGSKWKNNELRYTLRSLEKNFLDLGRVFVCGHSLPDWLQNIERVDVEDVKGRNKDANIIDKVLAALDAGMSDPFVRCSDDETMLLPTRIADMHKFHLGELKGRPDSFWHNGWKHRLRHTRDALAAKGLPALHYDSHVPTLCNATLFRSVAASFDYRTNPGYTINTLYCNHEGLVDPPRLSGNKLTIEGDNKHSVAALAEKFAQFRYLGYNDGGLNKLLKKALQEAFPMPSRFELPAPPLPMVVAVVALPDRERVAPQG